MTDVLLRYINKDNISQTSRITLSKPQAIIKKIPDKFSIAGTYTILGMEHILFGVDHLLFIFALLILVNNYRMLIWSITAFTVAHSLTLIAASLGFIHAAQQPIEAIIALSIVFLAREIARGGKQQYSSISLQWPWMVAFIFGLLHGLGFANALNEVGLPQHAITIALLFFNIGVEIWQLIFITIILIVIFLIRKPLSKQYLHTPIISAYFIGSIATFWTLQRIISF